MHSAALWAWLFPPPPPRGVLGVPVLLPRLLLQSPAKPEMLGGWPVNTCLQTTVDSCPGGGETQESKGDPESKGVRPPGSSQGPATRLCGPQPMGARRLDTPVPRGRAAHAGCQEPQRSPGSRPRGRAPSTWPGSASAPGPARPAAGRPCAGRGPPRAAAGPPPGPGCCASGGPCLRGTGQTSRLGPRPRPGDQTPVLPPPRTQQAGDRRGLLGPSWGCAALVGGYGGAASCERPHAQTPCLPPACSGSRPEQGTGRRRAGGLQETGWDTRCAWER